MNMMQVMQSVVWAVLLWPCLVSLGVPLECKDEQGSIILCASISKEKLLDRVIQHAELIYRVSEESCTLFEEMFVPFPMRSQRNQAGYTCATKAFPIPGSKSEIQQISMLDDDMLTNSYYEQGVAPYALQPEVLESVLRDYTLLSCFKKDAHKMETFLKLLKCRQTDKYSCFLH
uniref:Somatolactin alpha n=1 Tax=Oncorhynchus mykiss TaxID=8022 RepID=A0A8C7UUW2_ONCMY